MARAEAVTAGQQQQDDTSPTSRRRLMLTVLLPAALLSLLLHLWAVLSPLAVVNSDEAMTGLQAYGILQGRPSLMVAGNDYGGALEAYLTAPLLLVTGGTVALKVVPIALSGVAGLALAWASRPLLGARMSLVAGATSWVSSGAAVVVWSINYMGYASGATAMVLAIGCSVRLMTRPRPVLGVGAGLAAGVAMWGHPIFGVVAGLALLPTLAVVVRRPLTLVATVAGGLLGVSPWLVYLARHGRPNIIGSPRPAGYAERVWITLSELLPSGLGLRTPSGVWLEPVVLTYTVAAVLIGAGLLGLVLLPRLAGPAAAPVTVAGLGAVPALAVFEALSYSADGRYSLAFVPTLLVGLFSWTRWRRATARPPLLVAAAVPVVWGLAACVPSMQAVAGWTWRDPNTDAVAAVSRLDERGVTALRGDYWAVYVLDYYSGGELDSAPDIVVRLPADAARADATPADRLAYAWDSETVADARFALPAAARADTHVTVGRWQLWLPG